MTARGVLLGACAGTLALGACGRSGFERQGGPWDASCSRATPGGTWRLERTLSPDDWPVSPRERDQGLAFGRHVALRGNLLTVGAALADGEDATTGAVFVYWLDRAAGQWYASARVTAIDGRSGDRFGRHVLGDNGLLAVDAWGTPADWSPELGVFGGGAVYLFEMGESSHHWRLRRKLAPLQLQEGVAGLSPYGGELAVGRAQAGAAQLWTRSGQSWAAGQLISRADTHRFGASVALHGDRLAIGDDWYPPNNDDHGRVFLYQRDEGGSWGPSAELGTADVDITSINLFGAALALVGNRLFVGSPADDEPTRSSGSVYIFALAGERWTLEQALRLSPEELYLWDYAHVGAALAAMDDRLVVGAPQCATPQSEVTGCVFVFERDGASWTRTAKLYPPDDRQRGRFGDAVALCGDRLVVGAPDRGAAYVYHRR